MSGPPKRRRPPQNRRRTGGDAAHGGRFEPGNTAGAATQFQPGISGNPGGRSRSLSAAFRAEFGDNGEKLIEQIRQIISRGGGTWGKVEAIKVALGYGWGKVPQHVTIEEVPQPHSTDHLMPFATDEERALAEDLVQRWTQRYLEAQKTGEALPAPLTEGQEDA
jgi:hypothetical protein